MDSHNLVSYGVVYLISFIFFANFFYGIPICCSWSKYFKSFAYHEQVRIRAMSLSNFHHVIVLIIGIHNLMNACRSGEY